MIADLNPLQKLCVDLREEMGTDSLTSANLDKVMTLLANYESNKKDWEQYAIFDEGRYTRNLVDDGNGKYNLMLLCWPAGIKSAIHDHSGSHCLLKVLEGNVEETLYNWPDSVSSPEKETCESKLDVTKQTVYKHNEVTYMHDKLGIHRISNISDSENSVSLHLYSPPYVTCKTFCQNTGQARCSGNIVFHSINGEKNTDTEALLSKFTLMRNLSSEQICQGRRKGL